jgi:hypothetical protein
MYIFGPNESISQNMKTNKYTSKNKVICGILHEILGEK